MHVLKHPTWYTSRNTKTPRPSPSPPALPALPVQTFTRWMRRSYASHRFGQHVVLTGHVTPDSARTFLTEFYHPDRGYQVGWGWGWEWGKGRAPPAQGLPEGSGALGSTGLGVPGGDWGRRGSRAPTAGASWCMGLQGARTGMEGYKAGRWRAGR